jgi:hypothetical protein
MDEKEYIRTQLIPDYIKILEKLFEKYPDLRDFYKDKLQAIGSATMPTTSSAKMDAKEFIKMQIIPAHIKILKMLLEQYPDMSKLPPNNQKGTTGDLLFMSLMNLPGHV